MFVIFLLFILFYMLTICFFTNRGFFVVGFLTFDVVFVFCSISYGHLKLSLPFVFLYYSLLIISFYVPLPLLFPTLPYSFPLSRRIRRCQDLAMKHETLPPEVQAVQQPLKIEITPIIEDLEQRTLEREKYQ